MLLYINIMPRRQNMKGGLSFGQIKSQAKKAVKAGKPVAMSIGKKALDSAVAEAKKQGLQAIGGKKGGRRGRPAVGGRRRRTGAGVLGKTLGSVGSLADIIGLGRAKRGGGLYLPSTYR